MGGTCKAESRESRRDEITSGAMRLGELASGERAWRRSNEQVLAQYPGAVVTPVPDEMVRDSVGACRDIVQFVKSVVAEELEPYRETLDRLTRDACKREAVKAGIGAKGVAPIAIGDTFRWVPDGDEGHVAEVVAGPFPHPTGALGQRWEIETNGTRRLRSESLLLDASRWIRVRAVELPPVLAAPEVSRAGGYDLPDGGDDDLDGPAGDERAPGLSDAGEVALGSVARADLDGLLDDVAKLVKAWAAFAGPEGEFDDVDGAVSALALRAGQLRPSRLAGGQ